ncbi:MAG TPA: hypothetical protein VM054_11845 [bacterium]|nr:hypothetical protein [bacterium]
MKKSKRPNIEHPKTFKKQPSIEYNPSAYYELNPKWSFSYLQLDGKWCWSSIQRVKLLEIIRKVKEFEKLKWKELLRGNHPAKSIPLENIITEAQGILIDELRIQQDEIVRFRLSGEERIWGLLVEGVFNVIFWDPEHEVCPSELKHT